MATLTYDKFVQQIRELAREGEVKQVHKMLLLVELFRLETLWMPSYRSWKVLLAKEKLSCTATLFNNFYQALKVLSEKDVEKFGVRASARIGCLPSKIQAQIVEATRDWWKKNKIPPEYQLVTQFVSNLVPAPKKVKNPKVAEGILLRHIHSLNCIIRAQGLTPPKMPPF